MRMSHVTHINESCHIRTYAKSRVTYQYLAACANSERAMSYVLTSHVTHANVSWHTYGWVMSHIGMRHVTRMDEWCDTYDTWHTHTWCDMYDTWHMMTRDDTWHTSSDVTRMTHDTHTHQYLAACAIQKRVRGIKTRKELGITFKSPALRSAERLANLTKRCLYMHIHMRI